MGEGVRNVKSDATNYASYPSSPIFNTSHVLAFRKGDTGNQVVYVVSNFGAYAPYSPDMSFTLPSDGTGFLPGQNLTEIVSCQSLMTDSSGSIAVDLRNGGPRVYYPTESLGSSVGICEDDLNSIPTSTAGTGEPTSPTPTDSGAAVHIFEKRTRLIITIFVIYFLMFT